MLNQDDYVTGSVQCLKQIFHALPSNPFQQCLGSELCIHLDIGNYFRQHYNLGKLETL